MALYSPSPLISEKAMAPHSSTLAWKIPWTEEPGGLQSMGSLRVRHDWATSLSLFTFLHWRRKWQPTPVFLPGESQGRRSLVGCRLWGRTRVGHDWSDLAAAAAVDYMVLIYFWPLYSILFYSIDLYVCLYAIAILFHTVAVEKREHSCTLDGNVNRYFYVLF